MAYSRQWVRQFSRDCTKDKDEGKGGLSGDKDAYYM